MADETQVKEPASKVGGRRAKAAVKEERIPVNQLSAEEREALREKASTTSSGQGQPATKGVAAALAAGRGAGRMLAKRQRRAAYKIIFFIGGNAPTVDEYNEAQSLGQGVVFRNARKIVLGAPLENCDAVAGEVPPDYEKVFPSASAGMTIDDEDDEADLVGRPRRVAGQGTAPDEVRPGTVDTGLAHATGTGSSQPGVKTADPTKQEVHDLPNPRAQSEQRAMASEWKSNKTPGAVVEASVATA